MTPASATSYAYAKRRRVLRQCAAIVRRHYPTPPARDGGWEPLETAAEGMKP